MSFENLGLNDNLVRAVEKIGFEHPSPIQEKAIPEIIGGHRDMVGLAQTGTGKTASFGLPMIQLVDFSSRQTQGLVICPTRELCIQISDDFQAFSHYTKGAKVAAVYGGASIVNQIRQIKKGVQIIVATPGRLLDLINRRVVNLENISYVVLDEADEMLNMGFQEDLDEILKKTPDDKRTWLFSATMPKEVARIAGNYMDDPVEITVGKRNSGAANIKHINYLIREKHRYAALKRIIDFSPDIYGLIFCRTRKETQDVAEQLIKDGYDAESLHGDLSQAQRDKVMARFREKNLQILVATDVAARGIDVKDITHVIHYKLPDEAENYTHRSGRTARAGKSGVSLVLMNIKEKRRLQEVERKAGITFQKEKVPSGYAVCENQLISMVNKLVEVDVNEKEIEKFLPPVYETLAQLTKEELIQKVVSTEFNRFLSYYKNAEDINLPDRKESRGKFDKPAARGRKDSRNSHGNFDKNTRRFFINVGRLDDIRAGAITRLLCDNTGIRSAQIGKIELMREFSFFEVESSVSEKVYRAMKKAKLDGRQVKVEFAEHKKNGGGAGPRKGRKKRF